MNGKKKHTIYQNQWDINKAEHRGKYVAINASIEKVESSQIHNLTSYFKILEMKENQTQKKKIRRKEILNTRVEINEREWKK